MQTNIKKIRVSSFSLEVSEPLHYQDSVVIGLTGDVTDIHGKDNCDGTQNVTYTVKPTIVQVDRVIPGYDKKTIGLTETAGKSRSKQLRAKAYRIAQSTGESPEALYNSAIDEANTWLDNHESEIINKDLV